MTRTLSLLALALLLTSCGPAEKPVTLGDAFSEHFLLGGALGERITSGADSIGAAIAAEQFSTITAENVLKFEVVHPRPDVFDFARSDDFVAFGEANGQFIVGHCLVWHSQTPAWVFQDADGNDLTRDALLARMENHISKVVGRYAGRIGGWDVVNEALNEDGTLRDTPYRRIIGDDYIQKAFEFARAADPDVELYYNDYSLANPAKRAGAIRIVRGLQEAGVDINGVGEQGHYQLDWPTVAGFDSTVVELASMGIPMFISELDIDLLPFPHVNRSADISISAEARAELNPYVDGLPEAQQTVLAERYAGLFGVLVARSEMVSRVTFWGVTDSGSWLNGWPIPGRTSYPLLFARDGSKKPAYDAVMGTLK